MLHFNELYITDDGKKLIIDAAIDNIPGYDNCYIDTVSIDFSDQCAGSSPINVYQSAAKIIGDLDEDGVVTKEDIDMWRALLNLIDRKLLKDDDGYYYIDLDDEFEEYHKYVNPRILTIMDTILSIEPITGIYYVPSSFNASNTAGTDYRPNGYSNNITYDRLLTYISNSLGSRGKDLGFGNNGDLLNDGEVNIADINYFISWLNNGSDTDPNAQPMQEVGGDVRTSIRICVELTPFAKTLFSGDMASTQFVVVRVTSSCPGSSASDIAAMGCTFDENEITGVAYNAKPLYDAAVNYASSYGNTCETNDASAFEDFIMRYYGFIFALKCGDLCQAQYYWNNYLASTGASKKWSNSKPCGCNGTR